MTGRRHKLGGRLLLILLICGALAIAALLGTLILIMMNYTSDNSIARAESSVKALEAQIQALEERSLRDARLVAGNAQLAQAIATGDVGAVKGILSAASQNSGASFLIATDKRGNALHATDKSLSLSGAAAQKAVAGAAGGAEGTLLDAEVFSRLAAVSFVPVNDGGAVAGTLVLGYALDDEKIVDGVKAVEGDDVTIFLGDIRINTTIEKAGQRVIGTQASAAVVEKVLKNGESYSGDLDIEGIPYVAYYMPLKDTAGNAIGILFGGNPQTRSQEAVHQLILWFSVFAALALTLLAVLMSVYTRRAINRPLKKLLETARQIASGNLNAAPDIRSNDEIGELAEAFDGMSVRLSETISGIGTASDQITEGARQVSMSSVALASGATEQASAVEEFSASLEEISAQTTQNADRAGQANELSRTALHKAREGNVQMQAMLTAMSEINRSSEVIARIIKVIDDIAFQTNILALNAAVEAARAGEHGKGFAVVAEEVRSLAARSAEAAKETTASIGQSIQEVGKGAKIADATAEMLASIVDGVSKTASLVDDIALACQQQVTAILQMGQGIHQITGVMQSNSATSEQNSAASEELLSQAEFMKKQVSHFTLRDQDAPAAPPRPIGA